MMQPSVLLVEDDAFQRKAAETYLMNHDLRVIAVENGAQMRRQISRAMPDLVLLDVQLPGQEDGFALARWLRAYIDHVSAKHGLAAAFATGRRDDSELVAACQAAVGAIGTSLLRRAQRDGVVRDDVELPDVVTLINAIAMATETADSGEADRMLAIVVAGIASRDHA